MQMIQFWYIKTVKGLSADETLKKDFVSALDDTKGYFASISLRKCK